MLYLNDVEIHPTIFPDKTSQVWKLPENLIKWQNKILWRFESEAELFHLVQLVKLIKSQIGDAGEIHLNIPYCPYARQDKPVSNTATFARICFFEQLEQLRFTSIEFLDIHSTFGLLPNMHNVLAENYIDQILIKSFIPYELQYNYVIFPDSGAKQRYDVSNTTVKILVGTKYRNQQTGQLANTHYEIPGLNPDIKSALVIDDICDGGATFILLGKNIKEKCPNIKLDLYVTHGIFSKGTKELEKYYDTIYTTNSLKQDVNSVVVLQSKDGSPLVDIEEF